MNIRLVAYDPGWPQRFAAEAAKIRGALGARALLVEHVGSTSVAGLAAKPVIDIVLAVADAADEAGYAAGLTAAGYELRIREPEWHQHRLFRDAAATVNLHVFSAGCAEIGRMLAFRDRLRASEADRRQYEGTKRALAEQEWRQVQDYADAKTAVVAEILARAAVPT